MDTKNTNGYVVRVSEHALLSMVLNGIEAYTLKHQGVSKATAPHLETYGNLFGYEIRTADDKTLYQVELVNIDTSAKRSSGAVEPNLEAMSIKSDCIGRYWPHLECLGDYHTHPYANRSEVLNVEQEDGDKRGDNRGYFVSKGDKDFLKDHADIYEQVNYRVGLVLTIAKCVDKGRDCQHIKGHCIEFNMLDFKLWLSAYCVFKNEKDELVYTGNRDKLVWLECPYLNGFLGQV